MMTARRGPSESSYNALKELRNRGWSVPSSLNSLLRFGVFELDLKTGELWKAGRRINLQPQPFKVLALLAGRAGELITREEIRQHVWGDDTFVDFEQGLNFAINRIRAVLDDDAQTPHCIETLPRRGYRFIGPVNAQISGAAHSPHPEGQVTATIQETQPRRSQPISFQNAGPKWRRTLLFAGMLAALIMALALRWYGGRDPGRQIESRRQITANSVDDPVFRATVSPDGKYLAYTDSGGIHLRQIDTGETHSLPVPEGLCFR
jgi:DNA-binding winged helix-turn-helix (wHTH) protein